MAFSIGPSPTTAKAWGRHVRHPKRIDLCIIVFCLWTSWFAIANAILAISSYEYMQGYYNLQFPLGVVCLQLISPFIAALISCLNLGLYTTRTLRPAYALASSLIMTIGWIITLWFWIVTQIGFPEYLGWSSPSFSMPPSVPVNLGVWAPKLFGGLLAVISSFVYFIFAWKALLKRNKHRCCSHQSETSEKDEASAKSEVGAESVSGRESVLGNESVTGTESIISPPSEISGRSLPDYYDIISLAAQRRATADIDTQQKKPEVADTCHCPNCVSGGSSNASIV